LNQICRDHARKGAVFVTASACDRTIRNEVSSPVGLAGFSRHFHMVA